MSKKIIIFIMLMMVSVSLFAVPTDSWIIERLGKVTGIGTAQAVTENNDPNKGLGKTYLASVYFEVSSIDQSKFTQADVVGKGTGCGGCIEVYPSVEQAENRNLYLSKFDGTIFSSGGHIIFDTMVIRTSSKLTASEQKELEDLIIKVFKE